MAKTIYALLVGINEYLGGVPGLNGCVNDVKRMHTFLEHRAGDEFTYKPLVLTSGDRDNPDEIKPTRQAVIDGFLEHLGQAGEGDLALFYYSGHGSQEKAPPEFWHVEPDHLDETLVCYDSRLEGSWDLADKELALLIAGLGKKKPDLLLILDSCHSGSITRAPEPSGIRLAPDDGRVRPLESFYGYKQIKKMGRETAGDQAGGNWLHLPEGRHIAISACRAEEVANERFLGGEVRGLLSYYLLDTLQRTATSLSYRDLFARASSLVHNQVGGQNPIIEVSETGQLQAPFLGGAIKPQPPYFNLAYSLEKGWVINGGAIHGIPAPVGEETTTLAVFPAGTDLAAQRTLEAALGYASVTAVEAGESQVDFTVKSGEQPDRKQNYSALVVNQPLPQITVCLQGDPAGLQLVRDALATAGPGGAPSLLVRELQKNDLSQPGMAAQDVAPLTLTAQDNHYLIRRSGDAYPLMVRVQGDDEDDPARKAVQRLEHIARWLQIAELENKTSALPPDAVEMQFFAANPDGSPGERLEVANGLRLEYTYQNGKWIRPSFLLKLVNNTDRKLYVMLLDLEETFAVRSGGLIKSGGEWLDPHGETKDRLWAYQGKPIPGFISNDLRQQGVVSIRDILKLIVSTTESDATLLEREALEVATRGTKGLGKAIPKSPLNRLLNRIQERGLGSQGEDEDQITDWITAQVVFTTVWPRQGVDLPRAGTTAELSDIVTIEGHPVMQGSARLTTFSEGARDAGNLSLPTILRQHPELSRPFELTASRSGEPGLSVLEIQPLGESYRSVTPENPLVLRVAKPLQSGEVVLPIGFDETEGLFLPLGVSQARPDGATDIRIQHLPPPVSAGRDVAGAIKLFFQKVVGEKIGLAGETHRLAEPSITGDGKKVEYDSDKNRLAEKVRSAQRILLYIHGFVGDTRDKTLSAYGLTLPGLDPALKLADRYDLILTYDYENINTPIEKTAQILKKRLNDIGLGADHGKTFHIVAHSLGTMVTRSFIEQQGGNRVVQCAVLAGAPNAGTIWAKVQDLALLGLGAALNGLATITAPTGILPTLIGAVSSAVGAIEKFDVTLDQLQPDSDFYDLLNDSDDPGVPYILLAGNTSLIPQVTQEEQGLLARLASRLTSGKTREKLSNLVFFNKPNDMVISLESMKGVPQERHPEPRLIEVACDHTSYFRTEAGLYGLAEGLGYVPAKSERV